jgi:molecular chaperone GrpE (heat shock protein)
MSQQLWIKMANLVFELEKKAQKEPAPGVQRTLLRMQQVLEEAGLLILNPQGEAFSETRTDVEATLVGAMHDRLTITEVLKPIVYIHEEGKKRLVQRGVVLAG